MQSPFSADINLTAKLRHMAGVALFAIGCASLSAAPNTALGQSQAALIIGNDRGGMIGARAAEIDALRATGRPVEIRGSICFSSCTMYLGAANVCILPSTTFGFHGPSNHGAPLPADRFEHWSQIMARYYREPLRSWFMTDARYDRVRVHRLSGNQLIRMGYRRCGNA
ncbi:MAG: hypothetical protein JKX69_10560 [Rhodobacteraceae bacterium]|nr:hypothetical protein [Paracoccaceae bacterium]